MLPFFSSSYSRREWDNVYSKIPQILSRYKRLWGPELWQAWDDQRIGDGISFWCNKAGSLRWSTPYVCLKQSRFEHPGSDECFESRVQVNTFPLLESLIEDPRTRMPTQEKPLVKPAFCSWRLISPRTCHKCCRRLRRSYIKSLHYFVPSKILNQPPMRV